MVSIVADSTGAAVVAQDNQSEGFKRDRIILTCAAYTCLLGSPMSLGRCVRIARLAIRVKI